MAWAVDRVAQDCGGDRVGVGGRGGIVIDEGADRGAVGLSQIVEKPVEIRVDRFADGGAALRGGPAHVGL